MSQRLLLIEDERGLRVALSDRLASEGYVVETASDGEEGLRRATSQSFDLIVLDVMLPKKNGLDVCRDLRQNGVRTPILMLTARGETVDKVVGLKLGADDYLAKPFDMLELLARIEAVLRRGGGTAVAPEVYEFGDVRADFRRAEVTRGGRPVELSALELRLLRYLIERRGDAIRRDDLLNDVWGYNASSVTRTIDVHMAWLRQKLETNPSHPRHILTVHGIGYKFVP